VDVEGAEEVEEGVDAEDWDPPPAPTAEDELATEGTVAVVSITATAVTTVSTSSASTTPERAASVDVGSGSGVNSHTFEVAPSAQLAVVGPEP
tara:strand:+ start:266 stop:544 length:279 start_codon:yes stop_codon:yes gene_type:complete